MIRALIIGARRTRQGIGEFIARELHDAGVEVCGVVGSSPETAAEASRNLLSRHGFEAKPQPDLGTALEALRPDLVAVCAPFAVHREQLERVAEARAHCLCEKPMWWQEGVDLAGETARIVDRFLEQERLLELVTQWPETLPGFYRLYPALEGQPVRSFEMLLSPTSTEARAVLDSVPHVLSMLETLLGNGDVRSCRARYHGPDRSELGLSFEYKHRSGVVPVACRFRTCPERPRPAYYVINGCRADRTIELPEYTMALEGGGAGEPGRRAIIEDPLRLLVRRVVAKIESGDHRTSAEERRALIGSVSALGPLVQAVRDLQEE